MLGDNNNIRTGPGYWKCNTKILRDPNFLEDFENLWVFLDSVPEQDLNWWENCKIQFRQLIISHSMRISRISHLELKEAKRDLTNLIRLGKKCRNNVDTFMRHCKAGKLLTNP